MYTVSEPRESSSHSVASSNPTPFSPICSGVRFRFWGFGFRFQVFGCWISDLGREVSGFGFQASGRRFRISGFGLQVSGFGLCATLLHSAPQLITPRSVTSQGFGFRVSDLGFRVPGFGHGVWKFCPTLLHPALTLL